MNDSECCDSDMIPTDRGLVNRTGQKWKKKKRKIDEFYLGIE
jgi:hypothetical protein